MIKEKKKQQKKKEIYNKNVKRRAGKEREK